VGGAIIPIIAVSLASAFGWRFAMFGPGIICILVGIFLINRLRDTPRSLGLPTIEKYKNDYPSKHHERDRYQLYYKRNFI